MTSIILATYNGQLFLEEQLKSLINQSVAPNEIIIVDDCSTDDTLSLIEEFRKSCPLNIDIRVLLNKKNLGPARTFAKGVLESKGELLFFCDQDDIWFKDKIKETVDIFNKDQKINMLYTGYHIYDDKRKRIVRSSKDLESIIQVPLKTILKGNISLGCTMAFRSVYRMSAKLINEKIFIHDWFFAIIGAADNSLYYYDRPLIHYRIHNNNTIGKRLSYYPIHTKKKRIKSLESHIEFYQELMKLDIYQSETMEFRGFFIQQLIKINKVRLDFLNNKIKYYKYFRSIFYFKNYLSLKSVFGDFIYSIKRE